MMHGVLDDLLVGAVLAVSIVYAAFSLGPRALRRNALLGASSLLRRLPAMLQLPGAARRLEAAATQKAAGACGGCDSCGSAQPAAPDTQSGGVSAGSAAAATSEVRIPVSAIRRR